MPARVYERSFSLPIQCGFIEEKLTKGIFVKYKNSLILQNKYTLSSFSVKLVGLRFRSEATDCSFSHIFGENCQEEGTMDYILLKCYETLTPYFPEKKIKLLLYFAERGVASTDEDGGVTIRISVRHDFSQRWLREKSYVQYEEEETDNAQEIP